MNTKDKIQEFKEFLVALRYSVRYVDSTYRVVNNFLSYCEEKQINKIDNQALIAYFKYKFDKDISNYNIGLNNNERQTFRYIKLYLDFCAGNKHAVRYNRATDSGLTQNYKILLSKFTNWLSARGYSEQTLTLYTRHIKSFLCYRVKSGRLDINTLKEEEIISFVKNYISESGRTRNSIVSASKKFFKFLCENNNPVGPVILLNKFHSKSREVIPSRWTDEEFKNLIEAINRDSPNGKRNYAMLLLARTYGFRVSDIRNLKFENIDWRKNIIQIVQCKTQKLLIVPLLKKEGWAIIDYIKNGRPESSSKHIFIRHIPPYIEFSSKTSFWGIITRYLNLAEIKITHKKGFHSLRSTMASAMIENGIPLEVTSQILGHTNIESTKSYIRTSFEKLRMCCLNLDQILGDD